MDVKTLITISRPRFWLYLVGPFLIGYISGVTNLSSLMSLQFWLYFLYFLVPANVFLYGINDLADTDTDQYNTKKLSYEHELQRHQQRPLMYMLFLCTGLTSCIALITKDLTQGILLVLLLGLSFAYSYPPFRWKAKPFIDSASNVLYVLPGLFGYHIASGAIPSLLVVCAGGLWTAAMHLFSAIPDIEADTKAKLQTTAVVLGQTKSLLLCSALWWISMLMIFLATRSPFSFLLCVYGVIPLICLSKRWKLEQIYQLFPYLNALMGFFLFWIITVHRFL
jgi:4-hydroxybenzoate polyprenyltransferase